jgi:hypothetical protein
VTPDFEKNENDTSSAGFGHESFQFFSYPPPPPLDCGSVYISIHWMAMRAWLEMEGGVTPLNNSGGAWRKSLSLYIIPHNVTVPIGDTVQLLINMNT